MSELESDMQIIWELCVRDTYAIDPSFKPDLVIDGGGNIGLFTLRVATLASAAEGGQAKIVMVEPMPKNVERIRKHLASNGLEAEIKQVCIGGSREVMPFYFREAMQSSFDPRIAYRHVVDMPVILIQDAIGSSTAERILVKLDIEGMELAALRAFVPSEQRAVYVLGEIHDYDGESALMKSLFAEYGWACEFYEIYDNCAHFKACSPGKFGAGIND